LTRKYKKHSTPLKNAIIIINFKINKIKINMRDKAINDSISFDLNANLIKEFNNNISSGESQDTSFSFEPEASEFLGVNNFKEKINAKRYKTKRLPDQLK
jgi:hypothetical protein